MDYYLGRERMEESQELTNEETVFVLREIFVDAVHAGAIEFSEEVDPEDSSFKLQGAALTTRYTPGGGKKFKEKTDYFLPRHIDNYALNDECYANGLLDSLCMCVREVMKSS